MNSFQQHFSSLATHRLPIAVLDQTEQVVCVSRAFARVWSPSNVSPPHALHPLLDFPFTLSSRPIVDIRALHAILQNPQSARRSASPTSSASSSSSTSSSVQSQTQSQTQTQTQTQTQRQGHNQSQGQKQKQKQKQAQKQEQVKKSVDDASMSPKMPSSPTSLSEYKLVPIKASRFWLPDDSGQRCEFVLITFETPHTEPPSPPTANEEIGSRIRLGLSVLSTIIKDTADAMITITSTGTIVSFNPAASRIFGYVASEIVGQNVTILMPEPHRENHDTYIRNYQLTGVARIIGIGREVTALTKDGVSIPIHLSVSEIKLQDSTFYAGILRDLREAKKAEVTLAREHALLASVMDAANDAIITINGSGIVISVNRATCKIFGYQASEIVGNNVRMLMPPPYRHQHDDYLKDYLRTGKARIIGIGREVTCLRKNATEFPADLSVSQVKVQDSVFFTGILRDLTDRKKADVEIARGDAIIREVLMKSELLSKISNMFGEKEGVAAASEEMKIKIEQAGAVMEAQFEAIGKRLDRQEQQIQRQQQNLERLSKSVQDWVRFKEATYQRLIGVIDTAFSGIRLGGAENQIISPSSSASQAPLFAENQSDEDDDENEEENEGDE